MRIHSGVPGLGDSGTYDLEKYIPDKYFVNLVTLLTFCYFKHTITIRYIALNVLICSTQTYGNGQNDQIRRTFVNIVTWLPFLVLQTHMMTTC